MNPLDHIPSVQELLDNPSVVELRRRIGSSRLLATARAVLDEVQQEVQSAATERAFPDMAGLAERIARRVSGVCPSGARPVINATGRVFSSELSGPPLSEAAGDSLAAVASDYIAPATVDSPDAGVAEKLLRKMAGAEAARLVSSRAGALAPALAAVARGKHVLVSRAHLLDLGEGCRLPDVVAASGAIAREVGTVNQTTLDDYAQAIDDDTAAVFLLLDPAASGDACDAELLASIVQLAQKRGLQVVADIGQAAPNGLDRHGLASPIALAKPLADGVDVFLAGTRLLGGVGRTAIIAGAKGTLEIVGRDARAEWFAPSVFERTVLESTLPLFDDIDVAVHAIPALQLLTTSIENLRHRAERIAAQLDACDAVSKAEAVECESDVGLSMRLPTVRIRVTPHEATADAMAQALADGEPAILTTVDGDAVAFDLRSVVPRQDRSIIASVERLVRKPEEAEEPTNE